MRKAALHNLGCKVNAYETDAAPGKENESGRSGGGSRLLRAGGRRRAEKGRRYRCDHRQ